MESEKSSVLATVLERFLQVIIYKNQYLQNYLINIY